jgi:hypothetical protein
VNVDEISWLMAPSRISEEQRAAEDARHTVERVAAARMVRRQPDAELLLDMLGLAT